MTIQEFILKAEKALKVRCSSFGHITLAADDLGDKYLVTAIRKVNAEGTELTQARCLGNISCAFLDHCDTDDIKKFADIVGKEFAFPIESATEALVGKHGYFMWTGMMVGGTITKVTRGEHSVDIEYDMDKENYWGSETYHRDTVWGRLEDNFGPLQFTIIR